MRTILMSLAAASLLAACGGGDATTAAPAPEPAPAADPAPEPDPAPAAAEEAAPAAAEEAAPATAEEAAPAAAAGDADTSLPGDPAAGEKHYTTYCIACHQADGTGMGGALAADFVNDKTRLAKGNDVLLKSIAEGVPGTAMTPWAASLDEQARKDVLSYVRKTFGG